MHDQLSPNVITTAKIIRLFIRTPITDRFAKMEKAALEGHGIALFNAINEVGMLAPIVELATGGELTGAAAHSVAQQIITCAGNCGLFLRDEDGAVKYPNFRPVPGYAEFLRAAAPKSVLDEDDGDDESLAAWLTPPEIVMSAAAVPGASSASVAVAELDNRPLTGDNRSSDNDGAGIHLDHGARNSSAPSLSASDLAIFDMVNGGGLTATDYAGADPATLNPFDHPGAFIPGALSDLPGFVPFPATKRD